MSGLVANVADELHAGVSVPGCLRGLVLQVAQKNAYIVTPLTMAIKGTVMMVGPPTLRTSWKSPALLDRVVSKTTLAEFVKALTVMAHAA